MSVETHSFQADIAELMNLIIHAFYSNRDVFLREIVSNASDALDKQRHYDLSKNVLDQVYRVRILVEGDNKLIVEDTGVGMSKEDLIQNLSTIARSGTKEFVKTLTQKSDQIGQFGVGFYSVYLVADRVNVFTQKQGDCVYKWSSDAQQFYTLEETETYTFEYGHGTRLELFLKEDAKEYVQEETLRKIVQTHSSFITYPIELWVTKEVEEEVAPVEEGETFVEEEGDEEVEDEVVEDIEDDAVKENVPAPKKEKKTVQEWEILNSDKPIWSQNASDLTTEQYAKLYKTLSKDYEDPLFYRHFQTEGAFEFRGILYIPKRAPFDVFGDQSRSKRKIRLYVKNVLVLNELDKDTIPDWMNFVVGVIDNADLPLNVSREMLQQTKVLRAMKTQLKKQIQNMLNTLIDDQPELYQQFYREFQKNIKLGIHEGEESLLRFLRIQVNGGETTLDNYIDEFKEGQTQIFYATGEDAEQSVMTRLYESKGYKVLLFKEPIDEFMLQRVQKYKDHELINIAKEHETPWGNATDTHQDKEEFCKWATEKINDGSLEKTRVSSILQQEGDAPCCVLSSKFGWTGSMEKIMKSQPLSDSKNMSWMKGKKIFELNWSHPVIQQLHVAYERNKDSSILQDRLRLLYQSSLIAAGFPLENGHEFLSTLATCLNMVHEQESQPTVTLQEQESDTTTIPQEDV